MESIPIHSVPAYLPSTGRPQQEQNERKRDSHKRRPGTGDAADEAEEGSGTNDTNPDNPRRGSDGILGTLIDVEA